MKLGTLSVNVVAGGQVVVQTAHASYNLNTFYSYPNYSGPDNPVGDGTSNRLSSPGGGEAEWSPRVNELTPATIEVLAFGRSYKLRRLIRLKLNKGIFQIEFEDHLMNLRSEPTGVFIHYALNTSGVFGQDSIVPEHAENPTMFLDAGSENLGILVQDDVSRVKWDAPPTKSTNVVDWYVGGSLVRNSPLISSIALDAGRSYSIRWCLYILPKRSNLLEHPLSEHYYYFEFVNHVRFDWKTNFAIDGPFQFFDSNEIVTKTAQDLATYLQRKKIRVVGLSPMLDYYTWSSPNVLSRSGFTSRMSAAIKALKAVEPTIKCLGSIETFQVVIDPTILEQNIGFSSSDWTTQEFRHLVSMILDPNRSPKVNLNSPLPIPTLPPEAEIIEAANLPWKDSVWRQRGNFQVYLYGQYDPNKDIYPTLMLRVFPGELNGTFNYQHQFVLGNQIKFLEVVGFDGIYIDMFSQSWGSPSAYFYTEIGWDGISVDIDPSNSEIASNSTVSSNGRYIDTGLAGRASRRQICEYALGEGKTVVANTYPTSAGEQSLPINRFRETWDFPQTPTWDPNFLISSLASPIGLGAPPTVEPTPNSAERLKKGVMRLLRHGMVCYYYPPLRDISPETDGEYGPINLMFPLTPIALHEGWIEGKERIITAISGTYWSLPPAPNMRPRVSCFDIRGRSISVPVKVTGPSPFGIKKELAWKVQVPIKDWEEFAVIHYDIKHNPDAATGRSG
jgi:hypothetical protein